MIVVYIHRAPTWHILRAASPGGRIVTACLLGIDYRAICVSTDRPAQDLCPACDRETRRDVDARFDRSESGAVELDWYDVPTHGGEAG